MRAAGSTPVVTLHVFVTGKVQGVFYRDSTRREAVRLGVSGWVRNLPDGRVEGVFQGERSAVDELVKWCHGGPPAAAVEDVEARLVEDEGPLDGFRVRSTPRTKP